MTARQRHRRQEPSSGEPGSRDDSRPPASAPPSLLVVDDEAVAIAARLRRDFPKMRAVTSLDGGRETAVDLRPDLLVVGEVVAGEPGLALIDELGRLVPSFVLLTTPGVEAAVRAMQRGASGVLTRPLDPVLLLFEHGHVLTLRRRRETARSLARVEWEHVVETLRLTDGNKSEAARRLGIARTTLEQKLRKRPPRC